MIPLIRFSSDTGHNDRTLPFPRAGPVDITPHEENP